MTSPSDRAFTLLELTLSVWMVALMCSIGALGWVRVQRAGVLQETQQSLLWTLRDAQAYAVAHATSTTVDLAPFSPEYTVYHGAQVVVHQAFPAGINYVDGYLQMPSHRISYGPSGGSDNAGTIRLRDGQDVASVRVYRGSGLQDGIGEGQ